MARKRIRAAETTEAALDSFEKRFEDSVAAVERGFVLGRLAVKAKTREAKQIVRDVESIADRVKGLFRL